jgi:hypothetical protein
MPPSGMWNLMAMPLGLEGAPSGTREAAVVGKAHGHGNAAGVEERPAAQCRRCRRGDKAAFRDHTFGVV